MESEKWVFELLEIIKIDDSLNETNLYEEYIEKIGEVETDDEIELLFEAIRLEGRRLIEKSYYYAFLFLWDTVVQDELIENWHIKYLCDELQKVGERVIKRLPKLYDLIINISPGESKSTIASVLFPVWLWIRDPSLRVISGSHSKGLSMEHAVLSRDCIRSNKFNWLIDDFPIMKKDTDGKTNYKNEKGGSRKAVSTGSKVTGAHGHILTADDLIDPKGVTSDAVIKSTNRWLNKTFSSRKVEKQNTPIILIMQRLHEDDPTGNWLEKKKNGRKIKHICLPATDEHPISPKELKGNYVDGYMNIFRTGEEVLAEQLLDLGKIDFAAQYGQVASPIEGSIIKRHHFNLITDLEIQSDDFYNDFYSHPKVCVCDPSLKGKEKNDPTGMLSARGYKGKLYIQFYDEFRAEFEGQKDGLVKFVEMESGKGGSVLIEDKANGAALVSSINRHTKINAVEYKAPPIDKQAKIKAKLPFLDGEKLFLVKNHNGEEWDWKTFMQTCLMFPNVKHDEMIDVLYFMIDTFENMPHYFDKPPDRPQRRRFRNININ